MKANKNIQKEIEQTLNSLDNWQKVEADPFFYTRLSAKMEKQQDPVTIFSWLFDSPVLRVALVATVILINILSIGYLYLDNQSDIENDFADSFSTEYMLDQSTESYLVLNE